MFRLENIDNREAGFSDFELQIFPLSISILYSFVRLPEQLTVLLPSLVSSDDREIVAVVKRNCDSFTH